MTASTGPLMLIDGASLWFRAFHALPDSITAPDGRPVNAVRGFVDMIASLVTRERPSRLVVCLDLDWRPEFRTALIPSYKAHRVAESQAHEADSAADAEEVPDALTGQVDLIAEVLAAAGLCSAGAVGCEADDVIGTLADAEACDAVVVVSGDRDLLQVVADDPVPVRVLYVGRGLAKAQMCDPDVVSERYGVPAEHAGTAYAEMSIMRGDPSDGLPGVPGIGEKTAAKLITEFGNLANIRTAATSYANGLSARQRQSIIDSADYLDAANTVVFVKTDAPVQADRDDVLPAAPADPNELDRLATELGIESSVQRLATALGWQQ